ncbi:uncharacterized protein [Typha latifolia]|uniref:uncharacterized protein isoform X2 n=1 Tax=Typha latifolia TaxID=4733 RepID=UPI003C2E9CF1
MAQAAVAALPLRRYPCPWFIPSLFTAKPHHFFFSSFRFTRSTGTHARGLRPLGVPMAEDDPGEEEETRFEESQMKKSRNELKREARRAVKWGMDLAKFSTPLIKRVLSVASLEREVFDALMLVKKLGPDVREGRRRQFNYIGQLLRKAEPELMDALIQASKDGDNSRLFALSGEDSWSVDDDDGEEEATHDKEDSKEYMEMATRWSGGLICKDSSITNEVYSIHNVEFDRQVESVNYTWSPKKWEKTLLQDASLLSYKQELRKLVRRVQSVEEGSLVDDSDAEHDAKLNKAKKPLIRFLHSLARKALSELNSE